MIVLFMGPKKDEVIMQAIEKLKEQLDGLTNGLASKADIGSMMSDILITLKDELSKRDEVIAGLQTRLSTLETRLATSELMHTNHVRHIDDLEQYSRRTSLRFEGIEVKQGQTAQNLAHDVIREIEKMKVGVEGNDIDRAHRVGPMKIDEHGRKRQAVLVKFCTWKARDIVYKSRKKTPFRISADLTKRRLEIINYARKELSVESTRKLIDFVFVDGNCRLTAKGRDGKFYGFSSKEEFHRVLTYVEMNKDKRLAVRDECV